MTYTNILYKQGYQQFIRRAKNAGIDGLILPDMAIEEAKDYLNAAKSQKMDTIFLVSPNTEKTRLNKIAKVNVSHDNFFSLKGNVIISTCMMHKDPLAIWKTSPSDGVQKIGLFQLGSHIDRFLFLDLLLFNLKIPLGKR